ncbi:hypothetical protein GGI20_001289 [Coemansia sp. BCRC 34301]|nr:hypothetical protein GGI20_001289 [Coemansia sp. BCRC 34301]
MIFPTRLLRAQSKPKPRFGDRNLPRMDTLPRNKFSGMSRRHLSWTVIIVTIPFIVVFSNIVYKRLVLGEERRKSFKDGGVDSAYLLDNIASSSSSTSRSSGDNDDRK